MPHGAQVQVIEGQPTVVETIDFGLPTKMPDLLAQMAAFGFQYRDDFRPVGTRAACLVLREHRLRRFREGRWFARSGVRRGEVLDLRLAMCQDCGAVEVRDCSYDRMADLRVGRRGPNRRNHVIGWYSGKRPAGREYV